MPPKSHRIFGGKNMPNVVVGLDLHLKKTQGTVMTMDRKIVKQERFNTDREELKKFL